MGKQLEFRGVMPANLLPFHQDLSINEKDYRRHLSWLADAPGVTAIVCNGHAAEVSSLLREERRRALAIALDEVGDRVPLIAGVYTDGTLEAIALGKDARDEGASGLLIFPPTLFSLGAQLRPEMAYDHFSRIAEAVGLPMVVFQYPPATGVGYTPEILVKLSDIPQVAAIKEWSNDIVAFERNLKTIRETGRPVAILTAYTMSLLSTFILGADGAISGLGSVVAELQAKMFDLVQQGKINEARSLNDRLYPLVTEIYKPPIVDMHNRMKEALVLLGRLDEAVVRPPLVKISQEERGRIRSALEKAAITGPGYAIGDEDLIVL
jgi:4-hydroxy-tetrahydrodipicolinate synthase